MEDKIIPSAVPRAGSLKPRALWEPPRRDVMSEGESNRERKQETEGEREGEKGRKRHTSSADIV